MRICIFSSICLANKNLVDKDFVFVTTLVDLSIAFNPSDHIIILS